MSVTFATVILESVECCQCHVVFGLSQPYMRARREDHKLWTCPNGHSQHFTDKSDTEKLREELARKDAVIKGVSDARDYYHGKYKDEQASKVAIKGHLTRSRKKLDRVKHGVCPCCNRTFQNVAQHMETKHPNYSPHADQEK